jgi:hypothetical protein
MILKFDNRNKGFNPCNHRSEIKTHIPSYYCKIILYKAQSKNNRFEANQAGKRSPEVMPAKG